VATLTDPVCFALRKDLHDRVELSMLVRMTLYVRINRTRMPAVRAGSDDMTPIRWESGGYTNEVNKRMIKRVRGRPLPCLQGYRHVRYLTQVELARRAGLSCGMITLLESGKLKGTASTVRKLAGALGISEDQLCFEAPAERM
jgi:hypothetical protein